MLQGLAALPSAPLLAPGVVIHRPPSVQDVVQSTVDAVARLPDADVAIVVTSGRPVVHHQARVDLTGLGRPQVQHVWSTPGDLPVVLSHRTGHALTSGSALPVDAACLALHLGGRWPVVAVGLPASAEPDVLVGTGKALVEACAQRGCRAVLVAASDGSAGLAPRAPRAVIPGAEAWQERLVAAVRDGALADVQRLGPAEAARVAARGWAPLVVLLAAAGHVDRRLQLRHHGAPRGVGYLVADAA